MAKLTGTLDKPWPDFLKDIDASLSQTVSLTCVGGFVLAAMYGIPRVTVDLDYIEVIPLEAMREIEAIAGGGSTLAKKHRLYIQAVGGVVDLPEDYASRVNELDLNLPKLRLFVLDPYDLLLSKLTRNSPKDREDVKYLIQKEKLRFAPFYSRWEKEMAVHVANRDGHELTTRLWKEYFPADSGKDPDELEPC